MKICDETWNIHTTSSDALDNGKFQAVEWHSLFRKNDTGNTCVRLECQAVLSGVQLFATPWTVIHQAPLPMGFSQKEYWSELPFPTPGSWTRNQTHIVYVSLAAELGRVPATNGKNPGDGEGLSQDSDRAMKRHRADAGEDGRVEETRGLMTDCWWGTQRREGPAQLTNNGADILTSSQRTQVVWKSRAQGRDAIKSHSQHLVHRTHFATCFQA